jgi:acetylornithine deacetylase/succinyl-diaminopimelate desuccinylase-like protein
LPRTDALKYLENHHERFQNELIELLRIPSISHDPAYQVEMERAAWFAVKFRSMGIHQIEILPTAGHSVVYAESLATGRGASAPTVLIYGHYDVQSAEPLAHWKSQLFDPEIRNDNLYGATRQGCSRWRAIFSSDIPAHAPWLNTA